jgi:predicted small secreted protein
MRPHPSLSTRFPMKRLFLSLSMLAACSFLLCACNTVEGVGKDVKRAGEKIEGAAH